MADDGAWGNEAATALRRNRSIEGAGFDRWNGTVHFDDVTPGERHDGVSGNGIGFVWYGACAQEDRW